MTMKIEKTLSLILFFGLLLPLSSKPQYDALYHLISASYTLNDDGSLDYHFRKEIQLFTTASFDTYGETFITYNTDWQTLTINEAYTLRKDGSRVETPKNAFNPSLPFGCTHCERFIPLREMIVTHTALEPEAIIVLDYTLHTTQPFMQELMEHINLYENVPIQRYEISLQYPENRTVTTTLNYNGKNCATTSQTSSTFKQWIFTDLKQKPKDTYLPYNYLPYLEISTLPSPASFLEKLGNQNAFVTSNTEPYADLVTSCTQHKEKLLDKIVALRDYICDNIHTNSLPLHYMNYIVASPNTIWQTLCATPFEKNLLLKTLLQELGVSASFGILSSSWLSDPQSALLFTLNDQNYLITAAYKHAISLDQLCPSDAFIASTGAIYPFEKQVVNIDLDALITIKENNQNISTEISINKKELHKRKSFTPNSSTNLTVQTKSLPRNYYSIDLTDHPEGCHLKAAFIQRDRTLPLATVTTHENYTYTLTLPQNFQALSTPYKIEESTDFGSLLIELQLQDHQLIYHRQLILQETTLTSKKKIRQLRKMIGEWNSERPLIIHKLN